MQIALLEIFGKFSAEFTLRPRMFCVDDFVIGNLQGSQWAAGGKIIVGNGGLTVSRCEGVGFEGETFQIEVAEKLLAGGFVADGKVSEFDAAK